MVHAQQDILRGPSAACLVVQLPTLFTQPLGRRNAFSSSPNTQLCIYGTLSSQLVRPPCGCAAVILTCCIVLHPPAWHLLPVPLTQSLIQQLSCIRALTGGQTHVLANSIWGPARSNSRYKLGRKAEHCAPAAVNTAAAAVLSGPKG